MLICRKQFESPNKFTSCFPTKTATYQRSTMQHGRVHLCKMSMTSCNALSQNYMGLSSLSSHYEVNSWITIGESYVLFKIWFKLGNKKYLIKLRISHTNIQLQLKISHSRGNFIPHYESWGQWFTTQNMHYDVAVPDYNLIRDTW